MPSFDPGPGDLPASTVLDNGDENAGGTHSAEITHMLRHVLPPRVDRPKPDGSLRAGVAQSDTEEFVLHPRDRIDFNDVCRLVPGTQDGLTKKDGQDVTDLQNALALPSAEKVWTHERKVAEIASTMQTQLARVANARHSASLSASGHLTSNVHMTSHRSWSSFAY
ncbi:phasin family protein [Paraburkholderia sp. BR14374]|uniref:phasin family protein n=1 Tax=Paraburkholderia sp. BR14374 TaxID=3237007 RepID=UPI0034CDE419